MRIGLLGLALAGCGGGTLGLGEDGAARKCPSVKVEIDALAFDDVQIGAPVQGTVRITNHCLAASGDLVITMSTEGSDRFVVSGSELRIGPAQSQDVVVTYTAPDYESASGVLRVGSNDKNAPTLDVRLAATSNRDQDGDGHHAISVGGQDCDDTDPNVNPQATEVWYDGVDQNCDGSGDFDQDGDGVDGGPEGEDCDDTNVDVRPGVSELDDLIDNDCDGFVDETFVRPGDLVVSEIMADPVSVFDTNGEWFEVTNVSGRTIELLNWKVLDYRGEGFQIEGSVQVDSGARVVFASTADEGLNGGVKADYAYERSSFELENGSDTVALELDGNTVAMVEYDDDWGVEPGASIGLDPLFLDGRNGTIGTYWCSASSAMSGGDLGTPGANNDDCASVDHDGDGFSADEGDCDDGEPTVYPGAADVWNGLDDNCDGTADHGVIDSIAVGWVDGDGSQYLATWAGLSVGDIDDDGKMEVLVASSRSRGWGGDVYALDGTSLYSMDDTVTGFDDASFRMGGFNDNMGFMGRRQADVTGDGVHDLVVSGVSTGSDPALVLWKGGSGLAGKYGADDTMATWGPGGRLDWSRVASHLDMDGDGTAEILMGDPNASIGTDLNERFVGSIHVIDAVGASGHNDLTASVSSYWGDTYFDQVGSAVDGGDLDADGYDDVVVCASYAEQSTPVNTGACFLLMGAKSMPDDGKIVDRAQAVIYGKVANERLGYSPAIDVGDIDDDGNADLVLGSGLQSQVLVYADAGLLEGTFDTTDYDYQLRAPGGPTNLGWSVSVADLDDDGFDDVLAGAPDIWHMSGRADEPGRLYVWSGADLASGGKSVDASTAMYSAVGGVSSDQYGWAMIADDFDNDGIIDVASSAPTIGTSVGRVYFQLGE